MGGMRVRAPSKNPYFDVCNDPWSAKAVGLPDEYMGATLPLKMRSSVTLTTNASGMAALGLQPVFATPILSPTGFTGVSSTITAWGGAPAALDDWASTVTPNMIAHRAISLGVCVSYIGPEASAAGEIIITTTTGLTSTEQSLNVSDWRDQQGAVSQNVPFITKPVCCAVSNFDRPPFNALSNGFTRYFPSIWIGVIGGPVGATFRVDLVYNFEFLPLSTSGMHQMANVTPHDDVSMAETGRRLSPSRTGTEGISALLVTPTKRRAFTTPSAPRKKSKRNTFSRRNSARSANVKPQYLAAIKGGNYGYARPGTAVSRGGSAPKYLRNRRKY